MLVNLIESSWANDFSGGAFSLAVAGNSLLLNYSAAPAVPPGFTSMVSLGSGGMQLGGTGGAGQAYVLQASTNLAPATWSSIATKRTNTNGVLQFSDLEASNYPEHFYRITSP
jgi:hypothetical protein